MSEATNDTQTTYGKEWITCNHAQVDVGDRKTERERQGPKFRGRQRASIYDYCMISDGNHTHVVLRTTYTIKRSQMDPICPHEVHI